MSPPFSGSLQVFFGAELCQEQNAAVFLTWLGFSSFKSVNKILNWLYKPLSGHSFQRCTAPFHRIARTGRGGLYWRRQLACDAQCWF